jgi:rhodanese-related sulfurtransferase
MPTSITRDELHAALDSLTVVDALPPAPYGQRHLPGALNLVAEDSDEHVLGALPDRAAAIVAYSTDAGCTRGPDLAARLEALGYPDVRVYRDGIADWVGAGLPVERPRGVELGSQTSP